MKRVFIGIVLFVVLAGFVGSQNFVTENPNYLRALQFRQRALIAFQNGEYEESIEHSREAERYSILARQEAELQLLQFRAQGWRNRAADRIALGERAGAEEAVQRANVSYERGISQFELERYADSIESFSEVVDILIAALGLPRFYVVQLVPDERDTLNKIAGYDFIYGDREQWELLYEANRDKLRQPDNPHLIHPGLVLEIPSIAGEARSGTWEGIE